MQYAAGIAMAMLWGGVAFGADKANPASDLAELRAIRQVRAQQLQRETAARILEGQKLLVTDPGRARDLLKECQNLVAASADLEAAERNLLLRQLENLFENPSSALDKRWESSHPRISQQPETVVAQNPCRSALGRRLGSTRFTRRRLRKVMQRNLRTRLTCRLFC